MPMLVIPSPRITLSRSKQPENILLPMSVTPLPKDIALRPKQYENADEPIFVTLSGMVTVARDVHL